MNVIDISTDARSLQQVLPRNLVAILISQLSYVRMPAKVSFDMIGGQQTKVYKVKLRFLAKRLAEIEVLSAAAKRWLHAKALQLDERKELAIPIEEAEVTEMPEPGALPASS